MSNLADALRDRRRELGLTQAQAAAHIGAQQQTLSRWERGEPPHDDFVHAIARFLNRTHVEVVDWCVEVKARKTYRRLPETSAVEVTLSRLTVIEKELRDLTTRVRRLEEARA